MHFVCSVVFFCTSAYDSAIFYRGYHITDPIFSEGAPKASLWVYTSPGPRFNINTVFPGIWDFQYKDKTVVRPSYLYDGNSYTGKFTSLTRHRNWNSLPRSEFVIKIQDGEGNSRFECLHRDHALVMIVRPGLIVHMGSGGTSVQPEAIHVSKH